MNPETTVRLATRYTAGLALLSNPAYEFLPDPNITGQFAVTKDGEFAYGVLVSETETLCSCPEFKKRFDFCKHTFAAAEILRNEALVEAYEAEEALRESAESRYGVEPLRY